MHRYILTLLVVLLSLTSATGQEPVKGYQGSVAKSKLKACRRLLDELNDHYKLRVTELTLAPGGHVGEHNHVGPGIRLVTAGSMTYVLPDKTVVYGPVSSRIGGCQSYRLQEDRGTDDTFPLRILPSDLKGPSFMPVKAK